MSTPDLYVNQVGGEHYQADFQHWDMVAATRIDYFKATITKYVCRAYKKNGRQDVEKAVTYAKKASKLSLYGRHRIDHRSLSRRIAGFITRNGFSPEFVAVNALFNANDFTEKQRDLIYLTVVATTDGDMLTILDRLNDLLNDPSMNPTPTAV